MIIGLISFPQELPRLSSPPVNESVNGTSITISWSAWNENNDAGDPPVIGYIPYYRKIDGNLWIRNKMTSADTLMFTANGLDPETSTSFRVSAVRDGEGGEGPKSEELNVTTICDGMISTSLATIILIIERHNNQTVNSGFYILLNISISDRAL
ncbi:hypothetical protein HOLleu_15294 [Holothuria leucospilota]|uniref:Fibronectin type-III domain-containing protein n=1 Tax=Holothuria leucospilota TaxID=206669 RepID=A0A9Q1C9X2_HOLLE|nr:hypothetical protein HOLleu_15294 [Holothuria leucospilota]